MKRIFRPAALCLAAVLFLFNIFVAEVSGSTDDTAPPKSVDIMFFHDTHSHLDSFSTIMDDEAVSVGGCDCPLVACQYRKAQPQYLPSAAHRGTECIIGGNGCGYYPLLSGEWYRQCNVCPDWTAAFYYLFWQLQLREND